jgi:SAM-dependent methyltransferase
MCGEQENPTHPPAGDSATWQYHGSSGGVWRERKETNHFTISHRLIYRGCELTSFGQALLMAAATTSTSPADMEWQRRGKWEAFYDGSFAPHLAGEAEQGTIDRLPWRTPHQPSTHLVAFLTAQELPSTARCCELGCGTGENLVALAAHAACTVGVDIVPMAIEVTLAAIEAAGLGSKATAICADILSLCDPNRPANVAPDGGEWVFDLCFDCQTFHCLRKVDKQAAARVYAALLRPGGVLLMLTGNANEDAERGPERLTREEVLSAFDGTPLKCESLEETRFDWTEAYRRQTLFDEPPLAWRSVWRRATEE